MKKLLLVLTSAALLAVSSFAFADLNIGVLDMQKVMKNSPQVKVMQAQLKKQFGSKEKQLTKMQKQLQSDAQNYQKNSAVMKDSDKQALQQKIAQEQQDFQKQQTDFRNKVIAAQNQAMQKVIKQIEAVVDGVAGDQKLNLIVTKSSVVYSDADMDVTDQVIKKLK